MTWPSTMTWGESGTKDGEFYNPNDVAVDAMGRVFVADDGNNRLQVFTTDGQFLAKVDTTGIDGARPFFDAVGVAVSTDGIVYVADNSAIQVFRFSMTDPA